MENTIRTSSFTKIRNLEAKELQIVSFAFPICIVHFNHTTCSCCLQAERSEILNNIDIRVAAAKSGVRLWEIAEELGIADGNLSRKLRRELSPEEKERIFSIINQLAKGGK